MDLYRPSPTEQTRKTKAYKRLHQMSELKHQKMPHFSGGEGERSWLEYIDDSERLINGYTLSRAEQGKEKWQSNVMDNITRAKLRAIAAGVGLTVPDMKYAAVNKNGLMSIARADLMKNLVRQSFRQGNPVLHSFMEVWQILSHGSLFEYEGYETGGARRKIVKSFDTKTGEVQFDTEYVKMDGKPVSVILNPQEIYFATFFKKSIQDQPYIAWVQKYNGMELEEEFSKYKNYRFIKDKKQAGNLQDLQQTLFYNDWSRRVGKEDEYEVFRSYSLQDDEYAIYINGVEVLHAPMLWGDERSKYYPFAHTINEPFANPTFMCGMSLGGILEGYQDLKTTSLNTMMDKMLRSLKPPTLVGLANKDLLDIANELVDEDYKIYVPDVSQVKPFPFKSVEQADLAMYGLITQSIDHLSVDANQQGQQGSGVTAREVVIADERARQLKGILFMFLEDLWLQKNRLRVQNILTHYLKDKASRKDFKDKTITVPDVMFSDGVRGTLAIHVADKPSQLLSQLEIEAREQAMEEQGMPYKLVSMMKSYLHDWSYDFEVIPQSLFNQDRLRQEADVKEEMQLAATLFPEFFVANKDHYLREVLSLRGKSLDEFNPPATPPPPMPPEGTPQGAPQPALPAEETSLLGL